VSSSVTRRQHVNLRRYVGDTTRLTIEEAASVVEGQAVTLAPVDTGSLKGSIYRKVTSPVRAEVGATMEYAAAQEFGREVGFKVQAQPYLRPALDFLRSRLAQVWSKESKKARTKQ
jgi:hypothetical protein